MIQTTTDLVEFRILLADAHPMLRQALKDVLEKQADFEVVAEASESEEAVKLSAEFIPDVVTMDTSMPKLNGLETTKQIKHNHPKRRRTYESQIRVCRQDAFC